MPNGQVRDTVFEEIEIDMSNATWFDANMCAPLGALLYRTSRELNTVSLKNPVPQVQTILSKNGFLLNYGVARRADNLWHNY